MNDFLLNKPPLWFFDACKLFIFSGQCCNQMGLVFCSVLTWMFQLSRKWIEHRHNWKETLLVKLWLVKSLWGRLTILNAWNCSTLWGHFCMFQAVPYEQWRQSTALFHDGWGGGTLTNSGPGAQGLLLFICVLVTCMGPPCLIQLVHVRSLPWYNSSKSHSRGNGIYGWVFHVRKM